MDDNPRGVTLRVLGPLEVEVEGSVLNLGGPQLRALLALLVAVARPVSVATMVESLWDRHAPEDADRTVRTYISRLRKALAPAAAALAGQELILTRPPGYLLQLDLETIDAVRFERLAITGNRALTQGRPTEAAERLMAALALWRGVAYDEFTGIPALDTEGRRLAQLRTNAVLDRIDAELATGRGAELITELEALTATDCGNERLWGQLMRALYRAGRQSEALETFRRARQVLIERSGVEPSPLLSGIHRRILARDDTLLVRMDGADRTALVTTGRPDQRAGRIAESLEAGSKALVVEGSLTTSRQHFEIAHRGAARLGDSHGVALAMLGLCGLRVHEHRTAFDANRIESGLTHALAAIDPQSPLGLRLRVRLAGEADYQVAGQTRILAMLDKTRQANDPVAHAEALSIAHHCLLGPDHGPLRQELALELIGESHRTARYVDRMMGLLWHTVDLFLAGDPHAERQLGELDAALGARDHLAVGFVAGAMRVMLTIRSGRFEEAEKQAQACAELGQAAGDADAAGWHGGQLLAIRWFQGRIVELLPFLDDLVHSPTLSVVDNSHVAALAAAAAHAGDRRKAAGCLARLIGDDLSQMPRSSTWMASMNSIVEAACLLGDVETAAHAYDLLVPFGDLPTMAGPGIACFGSTHHSLGLAALTIGDTDRAVRHLHSAVQHNLALGHWPAVVLSRVRYARALVMRAGPGDASTAVEHLVAAAEEARALGMSAAVPTL